MRIDANSRKAIPAGSCVLPACPIAYRIAISYLLSVLALLALLGGGVYFLTEQTLFATLQNDLQTQAGQDAAFLQAVVSDPGGVEGTARALAPALAGGR